MSKILIIAGTHGVEPQSVAFAKAMMATSLGKSEDIVWLPELNPDGLKAFTRGNANGVDLNRNMPSSKWAKSQTEVRRGDLNPELENPEEIIANPYYSGAAPASEEETQALVKIFEAYDFDLVLSFHTNHFVANANPPCLCYDGKEEGGKYTEAYKFTTELSQQTGLEIVMDIGYPVPGSLGTYCLEREIPCITIEFDDEKGSEQVVSEYLQDFITCLDDYSKVILY